MCKIEATSFYMEINHKSKNIIPQMFSPEDVIQFMSDYQDKIEFEKTTKDLKPSNMNDIERIKDAVLLLINTIYANSQEETQKQVLKSIKDILNTSQPEGYQGLNKWCFAYCHDVNGVYIGYFKDRKTKQAEYFFTPSHTYVFHKGTFDYLGRDLTDTEIKEAILKGCEQNGIVEGARVSHVGNRNCYFTVGDIKNSDYNKDDNSLWLDGNCIFDNGKFAEVVKQDNVQCIHPYPSDTNTCLVCGEEMVKNFNCEDGNCIKQCDKCKDSFEVVKKEKPPIGLLPFKLHNEFRLNDLNKAIKRFQDAGKSIPKEWEAEHQSLTAYFKGFDSTDKELLKECRIDFIQALGLCLNDTHLSERIRLRIKQINEALN